MYLWIGAVGLPFPFVSNLYSKSALNQHEKYLYSHFFIVLLRCQVYKFVKSLGKFRRITTKRQAAVSLKPNLLTTKKLERITRIKIQVNLFSIIENIWICLFVPFTTILRNCCIIFTICYWWLRRFFHLLSNFLETEYFP